MTIRTVLSFSGAGAALAAPAAGSAAMAAFGLLLIGSASSGCGPRREEPPKAVPTPQMPVVTATPPTNLPPEQMEFIRKQQQLK